MIQYANGRSWLKRIRQLQDRGVKVFYEIDDYVQAARKNKSHELGTSRRRPHPRPRDGHAGRRRHDLLDRVHRPPLPQAFSEQTWECRNGIDLTATPTRSPRAKKAS